VLTLVLKLTLAPALVAAATYTARHVGNRSAGLLSGLPVVAGPIELIYTVERGARYAHTAAAGAILGIASLVGFCVMYTALARRSSLLVALVGGWLGFALATVIFGLLRLPALVGIAVTAGAIAAGGWSIQRHTSARPRTSRNSEMLAARLLVTVILVLALTAVARHLSPYIAGLLATLPIITSVMAGFTHAQAGPDAAIALLGGLTRALTSLLVFFAVLAAALTHAPTAPVFLLATIATLTTWVLLAAHGHSPVLTSTLQEAAHIDEAV